MQEKNKSTMLNQKKHGQMYCMQITNLMLPAVRASVAEKLSDMGYGQESIAAELCIAQAAVSKYMNGRYSGDVGEVKKHIEEGMLYNDIIESIVKKKGSATVQKDIASLCERLAEYYNS
jgi:predicted transcriptional regulator